MWLLFYWHKRLRAKETIVHFRDTNKYFRSEKTVTCPRWGSTKNINFFQKTTWEKFLVSDKWDFFPMYFLISLWFFPSPFKQTGIKKPSLAICLPILTASFFFLIYIYKKQHFLKITHAEMTSSEPIEIL